MKVRITFIDEWGYASEPRIIDWEDVRMVRWFADAANKCLRKHIGNRVVTESVDEYPEIWRNNYERRTNLRK